MLKEIAHFVYHAPGVLKLVAALEQAELYDTVMARADSAGLGHQRRNLVGSLGGEVLEIGCGTGAMFQHYAAGTRVTGIEPDESFLGRAERPAREAAADVTTQAADGMNLPFDRQRFDAVVFGLVLCSVPSVHSILSEARRVLKPDGGLHLIEHVKSDRAIAGSLMNLFNPVWLKLNGQGCNMNRNPVPDIEAAGFAITERLPFQVFSPGLPAFPMQLIRAKI